MTHTKVKEISHELSVLLVDIINKFLINNLKEEETINDVIRILLSALLTNLRHFIRQVASINKEAEKKMAEFFFELDKLLESQGFVLNTPLSS